METKGVVQSKTIWANAIALIALIANEQWGIDLNPEIQGAILVVINFIMRFVTKEPISLKGSKLAVWLLILPFLAGCAGTQAQKTTMYAVETSNTIQAVAETINNACHTGILDQTQCDKAKGAYQKAQVGYDAANSTFQMAIKSGDMSDWEMYEAVHESFTRLYKDMLKVAREFGLIGGE